jgi:hypothetical protein
MHNNRSAPVKSALMSGLIGASTFATAWFVTTRLEQRKRDR